MQSESFSLSNPNWTHVSPGSRAWWSSRGWRCVPRRRRTLPAAVWASGGGRKCPSASLRVPGNEQTRALTNLSHLIAYSYLDEGGQCLSAAYFVLDLPPWQLTDQELHQHVEERPQVIVTTHFLQRRTRVEFILISEISTWIGRSTWGHVRGGMTDLHKSCRRRWMDTDLILVCIDRRVADRSPEACHWTGLTNEEGNSH